MADSSLLLGEPIEVPRSARYSGKALVLFSLLIGLGLAAFVSTGRDRPLDFTREPDTTMVASRLMQPAMSPAMRLRQPPLGGMSLAQKLSKYGIGSTPLEKLAIRAVESANGCRDVSVAAEPKNMAGLAAPTGFFDPLGFAAKVSEGKLAFYREAELKHGRLCMLVTLGIFAGEKFSPLFGGSANVPAVAAFQNTPTQNFFWLLVLVAIGVPDYFSSKNDFQSLIQSNDEMFVLAGGRTPGDYGFDPLGLKPKDEAGLKEMQTKELNNGRLAMIAAAGIIAQELVDGKSVFGR